MRTTLLAITLCSLAACATVQRTHYQERYQVAPRALLWDAMQAARSLHYSIVLVQSPDVHTNVFLAFSDDTPMQSPTALLVGIWDGLAQLGDSPNIGARGATSVEVIPMAYRNGKAVPDADVPTQTRADAAQLVLAIDQLSRGDRKAFGM